MPNQRNLRWFSTLLIVVLLMSACGGKTKQKIVVPSPTFFAQPETLQVESTQSALPETVTPGANLPAETPQEDKQSLSGITAYHYPSVPLIGRSRPFRIGLLTGSEDPFYITLAHGASQAAINLGVEFIPQLPSSGSVAEQNQLLDALLARGDLDALLLSSIDTQALLPLLQKAAEAGIKFITLQTSLPGNSGLSALINIHTEDHLGGFLACQALIQSLAASESENSKTPTPPKKVYIQVGKAGMFDPDVRRQGCEEALTQTGDVQLAGVDQNDGDSLKASQQISAILASEPRLSGIVCTDPVCAQAASQTLASQGLSGKVKIIAFGATSDALNLLRQGSIDMLVTPKPYAMGYLAAAMTTAALDGVTSYPTDLSTGWEILTRQSMDDPLVARWNYDTQVVDPKRSTSGLKIAFVAGIEDPFYYAMQRGAQQATDSLGATLQSQFPQDWSAVEQTQILDTLSSSSGLDALLLVPTDPLALIPSLQKIANRGVPILALDTSLDASFTNLSTLSSNDQDGGYFACRSLVQAVGSRGKIYIQNVTAGIAATDAREHGCQRALSEFPEITLVAVNYNEDDPAKAQAQLAIIIQNHPDLVGVFCTSVLGAQAVGQYLGSQGLSGKVIVAAFDATAATQDLLRSGVIDMVVAQKPADMGYLGVLLAVARLDGVTDLPPVIQTGFALLMRENMDDPNYARYFYIK